MLFQLTEPPLGRETMKLYIAKMGQGLASLRCGSHTEVHLYLSEQLITREMCSYPKVILKFPWRLNGYSPVTRTNTTNSAANL